MNNYTENYSDQFIELENVDPVNYFKKKANSEKQYQENKFKLKKMRTLIFTVLTITHLIGTTQTFAQESSQDFKYRRSSLSMILIESESFPNKDAVMSSWNNFPFPDKYNKHDIDLKSFNINAVQLSEKDFLDAGRVLPSENQKYQMKIDKVMLEKKLANKLVASWFNRSSDGKFDMSLIQERGFYNATEMEASIAQGQIKGLASLADAGEELLKNTFVTFTKFNFVSNEPAAAEIRYEAKEKILAALAGKPQFLIDKALSTVDRVYERTKEGYLLQSNTWLYQLNWNDSIAAIFYNELWSNPSSFDKSNLFRLEYVGVQYNQSLVTFKIAEKRTQEQIIDLALVRNIDKAFAELQKDNDVFKPKVPVLTINPITAQIGMKEGLSGKERFDVLEMVFNQKTETTEYKKVGTATADKNIIWDNRYNAGENTKPKVNKDGAPITATLFKGSKTIQPGMLLKQVK